jgi:hypothetical protein
LVEGDDERLLGQEQEAEVCRHVRPSVADGVAEPDALELTLQPGFSSLRGALAPLGLALVEDADEVGGGLSR